MSSTINNIHICQQNPIHDNYVLYTQKINNIPFAPPLGGWLPCPSLYAIIPCTIASKVQTKDQGQEHNTHFKYKYCGPPLIQKSFLTISKPLNRSSRACLLSRSPFVMSFHNNLHSAFADGLLRYALVKIRNITGHTILRKNTGSLFFSLPSAVSPTCSLSSPTAYHNRWNHKCIMGK